jgi:hypothetical protein
VIEVHSARDETMDLAPRHAAMRPFGRPEDLDLEFGQSDRPGLVTAVLARCDGERDPGFWWSQSVGVRTAALLRLVAMTEERDEVSMSARCVAAACRECFEFELPLRSLAGGAADAGPLHLQLDDERVLTVRRPTGEDLRRWRAARPLSRADALRVMLDSLVLAGQATPEDEAVVSASIAAMDPLVDFTASCCCPVCGAPNEVAIDLEALALARLAGRQRALLQEVHRIASCYGWTESEVLAVPRARRALYLALIEDER